jgi:hypothetical protein
VPLAELSATMTKLRIAPVRPATQQNDEKSFVRVRERFSASSSNFGEAANHCFVKIQARPEAVSSNQKFAP